MRSLILALFACLSAFANLRANDLDVAGLDTPRDKTAAANRLLLWTRSLGYDAVLSQDGEDVFIKELKLTVSPVLNDDNGIDRLVIYNAYAGKPGNFGDKELTDVVTAINADQIAAQVSVLRTGSVLFVTYVSFDDKLSPILFRKFLEHSNRMAEVIINANPQLAKFIK